MIFPEVMPKTKYGKKKKPRNPIGTLGNSYNGRSRLGDRARMRHISRHPQSCSVRKRNNTYFFVSNETYFDFRVSYLQNDVAWPIKTEFVI